MARSTDPDVQLLQAAADPTRLYMLRQLSLGGPVCACDFLFGTEVSQPTISHHLKVLRDSGWVTSDRRGTWVWYSIKPEAVERFRRIAAALDAAPGLWASALGAGPRRLPVLESPTG